MTFFKKQLSEKEISFYQFLAGNQAFDFILFPQKVENDLGYFSFLPDGNLIGKEKKYFLATISAVASFHHIIKNQAVHFVPQNLDHYQNSLQATISYASAQKLSLPEKKVNELANSLRMINTNNCLIHDDFLPQNVMVDGEKIRIIDWADMRYGFPEHDVGRFLGDIHADKPDWQKKYYPSNWEDELAQKYLEVRTALDSTYDTKKGKEHVRLGKMWNYLGPIEMGLKRGEGHTDWFQANLQALSRA